MWVKFECGCIGIIVGPAVMVALEEQPVRRAEDVIVVRVCDDRDADPLCFCFGYRDFSKKSYRPLDQEEIKSLAEKINFMIRAGYRMQAFKALLEG